MPRQDVPYPGRDNWSWKCKLKEIWDALQGKLHSVNGVEGDGAGNVKIVSTTPARLTVSTNPSLNQIELAAYGDGGTDLRKASVTLAAADWSSNAQTVSVPGLGATEDVIVSADPSSWSDWGAAGIRAVSQAAGSLTFECDTEPTNDVTANLIIGRLST